MPITSVFNGLPGSDIAAWGIAVLIALLTLVQISPIRLNPWDTLFAWFGKKVNGLSIKKLDLLEKQVTSLWVNTTRQTLLTFARECRADIAHSSDEWTHFLNLAEEYEKYCSKHEVTNGVVTQDTAYVRALYQELSRGHRL